MAAETVRPGPAIPYWARPLVLLVAFVALCVLVVGWSAGIEPVKRILPGLSAMVPSTALLVAANSLALLYPPGRAGRFGVIRVVALFSLTVALTHLAVVYSGMAFGIDTLVWSALGFGDVGFDRMAIATALCFSLLAISLLTLAGDRSAGLVFVGAATGGLLISTAALFGYVFGVESMYSVPLFMAMALHTAIAFVILFTVTLFARPDLGWIGTLMGPGEGSAGARRLIPLIVGVPLLLCFIVLRGAQERLYELDFGLGLLAILIIVLLSLSVLRNARIQNAMQRQLAMRLQQLTEDNRILLQEVYHRVKNNLQQIDALIMLEARTLKENRRDALLSLSSRIRALAGVYELLLSSQSISTLELSPFLANLCGGIVRGSGAEKRNIACRVEVENLPVKVDSAIPIGLLVNELVANALKHAFTGREQGTIGVSLRTADDGTVRLIVRDDGRGMEGGGAGTQRTAGSRIVRGLIRQLEGSMNISTGDGTTIEVTIPGGALD